MSYLIYSFIDALIFGFAIYAILTSLFTGLKKRFNSEMDRAATYIIISSGLLFFVFWLIGIITPKDDDSYSLLNRMFGPYWFWYWFYIISMVLFTQLYWNKRLQNSHLFKIGTGIIFLIVLSYEKVVILITSFHRDFLPSSWSLAQPGMGLEMLYGWVADVFVFILVLLVGTVIIKWRKHRAVTD